VSVRRLQHVSTPYPPGRQDELRAFYSGLLGLDEKPAPPGLLERGIVWFAAGAGELELHFLPEPPTRSVTQRHFCLEVDDVDAWRRRLAAAGVEIEETTPIRNRPRFYARDPFGNLVELVTIQGYYAEDA
jgi:catechol 2,3-dioxygenase-like lactoylglutathione lyase family enzyme